MLNVVFFTFNPFQENTYIIRNEQQECWIIDPGMSNERENAQMIAYIVREKLKPVAIINTHAHIDHILGIDALVQAYGIPFGMHRLEQPVLQMAPQSAAMFGMKLAKVPTPDFYIPEGQPLKLGADEVEVLLTPGHSPGSISFYYPDGGWVIGGDVLFAGGIGRTDLPGGHYATLIASIKEQLFTLPASTVVFSGHGPATSIGDEQENNPFLQ